MKAMEKFIIRYSFGLDNIKKYGSDNIVLSLPFFYFFNFFFKISNKNIKRKIRQRVQDFIRIKKYGINIKNLMKNIFSIKKVNKKVKSIKV